MTQYADTEINACGLNCPLPILKARQALMSMTTGQTLKITATDPTSADDFPVFAEATGHELLAAERDGEQFIYWVKKGGTA